MMLASRVLITAGTPGHMYLEDRQAKCLGEEVGDVLLVWGAHIGNGVLE